MPRLRGLRTYDVVQRIYDTAGSREAGGCVQRMESIEESLNACEAEHKWSIPGGVWMPSNSSPSRSSPILCLLEREVSIFLLSRFQGVPASGCRSHLTSSFVFI